MQLRFLGTGTSMGVPVIGCDCAVCTSADPRNRRMRTSALIRSAGQSIMIDVGPDFRHQALAARLTRVDAVLLTHAHFDHVAGLDDLRPFSMRQGTIPIFGSPTTLTMVRERFAYAFDGALSQGSSRPELDLYTIERAFELAGHTITPLTVMHGNWQVTAYRIGRLGYVTDASYVPAEVRSALHGVDVLVLNALRLEPHPTHLSLAESLAIAAEIGARQTYLVHMTHTLDHTLDYGLPAGVAFAYDGLEVEIGA